MTGLGQVILITAVFLWVVCQNIIRCRSCRRAEIHWLEMLTEWDTFKRKDWFALSLLLVLLLVILI